jgi:hypothetical protein
MMAKKSIKALYDAERKARQQAADAAEAAFREAEEERNRLLEAWWAAKRYVNDLVTPTERKTVAEHPEWIAAMRAGNLFSLRTAGGPRFPLVQERSYYDHTLELSKRGKRLLRVAELLDAEKEETP